MTRTDFGCSFMPQWARSFRRSPIACQTDDDPVRVGQGLEPLGEVRRFVVGGAGARASPRSRSGSRRGAGRGRASAPGAHPRRSRSRFTSHSRPSSTAWSTSPWSSWYAHEASAAAGAGRRRGPVRRPRSGRAGRSGRAAVAAPGRSAAISPSTPSRRARRRWAARNASFGRASRTADANRARLFANGLRWSGGGSRRSRWARSWTPARSAVSAPASRCWSKPSTAPTQSSTSTNGVRSWTGSSVAARPGRAP